MEEQLPGTEADAAERLLAEVAGSGHLSPEDRGRLLEMARSLAEQGQPPSFILSALRSTAAVLLDLQAEADRPDDAFAREEVRRFLEMHPPARPAPGEGSPRREWKRLQRDRLQEHLQGLIRRSRAAKAPHEVKKMRNMLLKVDQREVRRVLGSEGEELCRQISTLLRTFASRI